MPIYFIFISTFRCQPVFLITYLEYHILYVTLFLQLQIAQFSLGNIVNEKRKLNRSYSLTLNVTISIFPQPYSLWDQYKVPLPLCTLSLLEVPHLARQKKMVNIWQHFIHFCNPCDTRTRHILHPKNSVCS